MKVKLGDLIKYKGHICKVRYVEERPYHTNKNMIEFDTPNHREFKCIDQVQLFPFTNDTVIFTKF